MFGVIATAVTALIGGLYATVQWIENKGRAEAQLEDALQNAEQSSQKVERLLESAEFTQSEVKRARIETKAGREEARRVHGILDSVPVVPDAGECSLDCTMPTLEAPE